MANNAKNSSSTPKQSSASKPKSATKAPAKSAEPASAVKSTGTKPTSPKANSSTPAKSTAPRTRTSAAPAATAKKASVAAKLPVVVEKPTAGKMFPGLSKGMNVAIGVGLVALIIVFSILAYNAGMGLYRKNSKAVALLNGAPVTVADVTGNSTDTSTTPEAILDYARRKLVTAAMDSAGVTPGTDAQLDSTETITTYLGSGASWATAASQQGTTEKSLRTQVSFAIRLNSYRGKLNLTAPTQPTAPSSKESSAAQAAYNSAMNTYTKKSTEVNAQWMEKLNSIFNSAELTVFSLRVQQ